MTDFPRQFETARKSFLLACESKGLSVRSLVHPLRGPADETLAMDVVRLGAADASRMLLLSCGAHGPELYAGSACVLEFLLADDFADLNSDTAVLIVHGLNPWGAAWSRRNTENNVDLCRNFLDFDEPLPDSSNYALVSDALEAPSLEAQREKIQALMTTHDQQAVVNALMSGQYIDPKGFGFGGLEPAWSNRCFLETLQTECAGVGQLLHMDFHTGLGPWAQSTVICLQRDDALLRARRTFGEQLRAPNEGKSLHGASGHISEGVAQALPNSELTSVVIEFGTFDMDRNLNALLDDHWLLRSSDVTSEQTIRQEMLEVHCPADKHWQQEVLAAGSAHIRRALKILEANSA